MLRRGHGRGVFLVSDVVVGVARTDVFHVEYRCRGLVLNRVARAVRGQVVIVR